MSHHQIPGWQTSRMLVLWWPEPAFCIFSSMYMTPIFNTVNYLLPIRKYQYLHNISFVNCSDLFPVVFCGVVESEFCDAFWVFASDYLQAFNNTWNCLQCTEISFSRVSPLCIKYLYMSFKTRCQYQDYQLHVHHVRKSKSGKLIFKSCFYNDFTETWINFTMYNFPISSQEKKQITFLFLIYKMEF